MVCCGDSFAAPSDGVFVGSDPLAVCAQKKKKFGVLLIDLLISQRFDFVLAPSISQLFR